MTDPLLACFCRCSFFGSPLRHALQQRKPPPANHQPVLDRNARWLTAVAQVKIRLAAGLSLPLRSLARSYPQICCDWLFSHGLESAGRLALRCCPLASLSSVARCIHIDRPKAITPAKRDPPFPLHSVALTLAFAALVPALTCCSPLSLCPESRTPPVAVPTHLSFLSSHLIAHLDKYCYSRYCCSSCHPLLALPSLKPSRKVQWTLLPNTDRPNCLLISGPRSAGSSLYCRGRWWCRKVPPTTPGLGR